MLRIIHYSLIRIYVKPFSWSEKIEEMLHKKTIILLQKINPFLSAIDRKGFSCLCVRCYFVSGVVVSVSVAICAFARLSLCSTQLLCKTSLVDLYIVAAILMPFTVFFGLRQEVKPMANMPVMRRICFIITYLNRNSTGRVNRMRAGSPPMVPGFHLGIFLMTRLASSFKSHDTPFTTLMSLMEPSVST